MEGRGGLSASTQGGAPGALDSAQRPETSLATGKGKNGPCALEVRAWASQGGCADKTGWGDRRG